jgi:hypothetical protein
VILDTIQSVGGTSLEPLQGAAFLFNNPFFAVLYLALPYIVMVAIDWYVKKRQKKLKTLEEVNREYMEKATANKDEVENTAPVSDSQSPSDAAQE